MTSADATLLLQRLSGGDAGAGDELMDVVYTQLHAMASAQMRGQGAEHTLQPTALVNEAWMKLVRLPDPQWNDRRHFFQVGAKAMRSVLVDHVRAKRRVKRDGGPKLELFEGAVAGAGRDLLDVVALDDALTRLAAKDADMARLVELRFFGGRTMDEVAECLEISKSKAERRWRAAKAWLFGAMGGEAGPAES
jgi:RNA polymerase sigma factor (TIGR02999 family)